jgi:hypothetical protein
LRVLAGLATDAGIPKRTLRQWAQDLKNKLGGWGRRRKRP